MGTHGVVKDRKRWEGRQPGFPQKHGKKLRYMSKIAAIFAASYNTQLICTQPIENLTTARL
jgi:hypothetical protein